MSGNESMNVKAKLGLDVFKEGKDFHISIKEGKERDERLRRAIAVCPAGLYSENLMEEVEVCKDGCLECGTCLVACGPEVLDWQYPDGESGVQYRFG